MLKKLALSVLQTWSGEILALELKKILEHEMVPKHEILSKKDSGELLKKYGITSDKLPKILENDSVIQVIKAKKGDIVKITRRSHTAGEAVYYRFVVWYYVLLGSSRVILQGKPACEAASGLL